MTRRGLARVRASLLIVVLLLGVRASAQESFRNSFQTLADRVIAEFHVVTAGIRKVRVDVRRPDTLPDADVRMVGMLRFDMKPRDATAWHSVRCVFGYQDGRWRLLQAFPELSPEQRDTAEPDTWYEAVVDRVLQRDR